MTVTDADTPLPDDLEAAHRLIRELLATLREQTHLNDKLQHQLELFLRRIYGRKTEKINPAQLLLFARDRGGRRPRVNAGAGITARADAQVEAARPRPQALASDVAAAAGVAR